jgi:hypothetical protein
MPHRACTMLQGYANISEVNEARIPSSSCNLGTLPADKRFDAKLGSRAEGLPCVCHAWVTVTFRTTRSSRAVKHGSHGETWSSIQLNEKESIERYVLGLGQVGYGMSCKFPLVPDVSSASSIEGIELSLFGGSSEHNKLCLINNNSIVIMITPSKPLVELIPIQAFIQKLQNP